MCRFLVKADRFLGPEPVLRLGDQAGAGEPGLIRATRNTYSLREMSEEFDPI